MTLIELPDEQVAVFRAKAAARGLTLEDWFQKMSEAEGVQEERNPSKRYPRKSSAEIILERMRNVPPEEFARLPKDGASEHDHYLYGHPKRNR